MELDIILGPPDGFLDWSPDEWDSFFQGNPEGERDKLGSFLDIASTIETICVNLEEGELGSRFPLFMRTAQIESTGWYASETEGLLSEIETIRLELATLPLESIVLIGVGEDNVVELYHPDDQEIQNLRMDFALRHPDRNMNNLADFNDQILDTLSTLAERARSEGKGLLLY